MSEHEQVPADGGSYTRDPVTGALTQVEPPTAPDPGKSAQVPKQPPTKPTRQRAAAQE